MLKHAVLIAVLGFLVPVARADTFDMTQITIGFEQFTDFPFPRFGVNMDGPNASLSYFGAIMCKGCELPVQFFKPGTRFFPGAVPLNPDGPWFGELGGLVFNSGDSGGSGLALGITAFGSFVFPQPSSNPFTACVPAANVNQPSLSLFGLSTSGKSVNAVVNLPTNTGKYCTTWSFGGSGWFLDSGSFTVTATPEPGTLALVGSGLLMLATIKFRLLRRKT